MITHEAHDRFKLNLNLDQLNQSINHVKVKTGWRVPAGRFNPS